MDIPWSQLTQLGAGGSVAVGILWVTFRFLASRRNGTEKILLKLESSESNVAHAMESIAKAIDNQTDLVEKMYDKQNDNHVDIIREINHGAVSRRND